ncbi:MAG: rod shape-determining protein RodA [Actinomycetota bacterium]
MGMQGILGEAVDRIGGEPIAARMARKAPIRHLDPLLLFATLALTGYGAMMVLSATATKLEQAGQDPNFLVRRQVIFAAVSVCVLIALGLFDYRHLRGFSPVVYGAAILLLVAVLTPLGYSSGGASRWINLGAFQMQPAEFAKLAIVAALAAYLAERKGLMGALDILICVGMVVLPCALIFIQPDLGTAMVFVAILGALLLVGGAKIRHFAALFAMGLLGMLLVLQFGLLKEYQIERITAFVDPNPDVRSEGYTLEQAKTAIGSGGMQGKGLGGAKTQTALDFVPEQHTDFIFTAVGEQLGFVGSATLLGLFALLLWRALRIASMSRDLFGTLLAVGIAALWAFQLFVNVGMTMGIMPITGIPLPFISYGGSSLLTNYIAVGLLMNIHMRRFL